MKKYLILCLFLQVSLMSGQEVLNGSFEEREFTPSPPLIYYYEMHACKNWAMATYSSDWLSTEISSDGLFGYDPRSGTGHARFAGTGVHPGDAYKEMIRGQVIDMLAGQEYNISFWVKRIDGMTNMNIGAYLSTTIPVIHESSSDPYVQSFFPQIEGVVPGDNSAYMKISGCFTPSASGLHYITIGVFEVYPGVEGEELNFFIVDDVDIEVATGILPSGSVAMDDEFCSSDDIIADGSSAMNYDTYQWQVYSSSGSILYASESLAGAVSTFDIRMAMAANGTPVSAGNCYILKLVLHGRCKTVLTKEFCITSSSIHLSSSGGPFCEGETINISCDGFGDWFYSWSTGEIGIGLSSINPTADLAISSYSVTATSGAGCTMSSNISVTVHPNPNVSPELTTDEYIYYTYPHEEVCFTIFSTDHPNESVTMTILGKPAGADFDVVPVNHEYGTFCWTPNESHYGEHHFSINLQDNNECGPKSRKYAFEVQVLCPLCPICVYYDGNTPDSDPLPALTEAVQCIEAGFSEPVVTGSDPVEFVAGTYIELKDFDTQGDFSATIEVVSCADECAECCENWTGFSYDEPLPNIFTPNGDGINDFWFLNDAENSYCAFNAFGYRIRVVGRWAGAGIRYEREYMADYCCPFEAANAETGLAYTAIHWDGYDKWGHLVVDGVYDVYVDLYGCQQDVHLWSEVQVIGGSTSLVSNDEDASEGIKNDVFPNKEPLSEMVDNVTDPLMFEAELIVYPSPSSDYVNLVVDKEVADNATVEIYNLQGKLCLRESSIDLGNRIDISNWPAGIYTVFLKDQDTFLHSKFVKH